jgi:hypothetical protein
VATVFSYWRTTVSDWKETNQKIDALWKEYPEGATSMTLVTRDEPRETHVLRRGDWLKPQKAVTPGVPAFLHPLPKDADGSRLTFARWLADQISARDGESCLAGLLRHGIETTSKTLNTERAAFAWDADWLDATSDNN